MYLDYNFFQVSKFSEDQKTKKKIKGLHQTWKVFSSNSSEDQKKGLHQNWKALFPQIQVKTSAQMHTRVKLLGEGCSCRPYSNYWRGFSQIIGGIYPPIPQGFGTPVSDLHFCCITAIKF